MSFTEIIIIAVVAVLVLGPEKLPGTLVELAKIIKGIKKQINEVKQTVENEINISELRDEAERYKKEIAAANESVRKKLTFDELSEVGEQISSAKNMINDELSDFAKAAQEAMNSNGSAAALADEEAASAEKSASKRAEWKAKQLEQNSAAEEQNLETKPSEPILKENLETKKESDV